MPFLGERAAHHLLVFFAVLLAIFTATQYARAEVGDASFYGGRFHGRRTASGEIFNQWAMTAAHPELAFGTHVRVTDLKTKRHVVVRINDRGPFVRGRIIDLSRGAAAALGIIARGVARVRVDRTP